MPRKAGAAHPRSRGENATASAVFASVLGSSPLTRGKQARALRMSETARLIPAHAGKTSSIRRGSNPCRAHPRSRGENIECRPECDANDGSSPLTRGKPHGRASTRPQCRLIPAHAGKTPLVSHRAISRPAHPRSRGENEYQARKSVTVRGSSPLTRGKPDTLTHTSGSKRLIPAHAGKTRSGP